MKRLEWNDLFHPIRSEPQTRLKERQRWFRVGRRFLEFLQDRGLSVNVEAVEAWLRYQLVNHARGTMELELKLLERMLRSSAATQWKALQGNVRAALERIKAEVALPQNVKRGPLGDTVQAFVRYKASLQRGTRSEETLLRLDLFLAEKDVLRIEDIESDHLRAFLSASTKRTNCLRLRQVVHFMRWLRRVGLLTTRPEAGVEAQGALSSHRPHIYTMKELVVLLDGVRRVDGWGGLTAFTALHLIYACGLRISEALRLRLEDVDLDNRLLRVNKTKFHKDRLVPIGRRAAEYLRLYLAERGGRHTKCDCVFVQENGAYVPPMWLRDIFRRTCVDTGLARPGRWLRIHDLRHTFAVHRLYKWYEEGIEPQSKLVLLSVYMGHVTVESTAHYLQMGPDLLRMASRACGTTLDELLAEGNGET